MNTQSPFALSRFEYGRTHLYYLPPEVFERLEREKPMFLIGSRGTGKTTLLTALTWREQTNNPSLKKHLVRCGSRGYIGVYIRMPDSMVGSLEAALKYGTESLHATVFAYYVDLLWLEEWISILAEILAQGGKAPAPASENETVRGIIDAYPCLSGISGADHCRTLRGLIRIFHMARAALEQELNVGSHEAGHNVPFPAGQVGDFGRSIAKKLMELYGQKAGVQNSYLKICFDEAECLSPFQQRVLNTMVRLSVHPVFFVISYVRAMDEMSKTLMDRMTLQNADRDILLLDEMDDESFRGLCEGVVSIRIAHQLDQRSAEFSTRRLLGSLSINSLILGMIKESTSQDARFLLSAAEDLSVSPQYASKREEEAPPIYQAFLLRESNTTLNEVDPASWRLRGHDSADLRKKMVAAYLLICKRFRFKVKYASADMLLQMCDKCVRDYLSQMNSVFFVSRKDLRSFLKAPVPVEIQAEALYAASEEKKHFIPESGISAPEPTETLIDSLALLTALVQTESVTGKSLSSTERGVFVVDFTGLEDRSTRETQRLIVEAAEAGFLKLIENKDKEWKFRVHCSLAAAYGFSYRGAYYRVSLLPEELLSLYTETNDQQRIKNIERISGIAVKQSLTLSLFEEPQ